MSLDLPSDDSDDLPDWLQGVDQPGDAADSPDSAGDNDLPDWLSGTGTSTPPPTSDPADDADSPDWLSNIQEAEADDQPDIEPDVSGGEDWLDNVREQHIKDSGSLNLGDESDSGDFMDRVQSMKEEASGQESDGTDDWLTGIGDSQEESTPAGDDSVPSWMAGDDAGGDALSVDDESIPSWMGESESADSGDALSVDDESIPSWMGEDDANNTDAGDALSVDDESIPSWMGGDDASSSDSGDALSVDDKSIPSWMGESESADSGDALPVDDESIPSWMGGDDAESDDAGDALSVDDESIPSWMGGDDAGNDDAGDAALPVGDDSVPSWLAGDDAGSDDASDDFSGMDFSAPAVEQPATTGDVPDWMADDGDDAIPGEDLFGDEEDPISADSPDWLQSLQRSADQGSSQPSMSRPEEKEASSIEVPDFVAEQTGVLPDWLGELQEASPDIDVQGELPEFTGEEANQPITAEDVYTTPQAGSPAAGLEDVISPFSGAEAEDVDLAPAELPSWLQAMRPTEAIDETSETPGFATGAIEGAGPLQGLAGILPAEPDIVHFGDAPLPNVNLTITPAQQGHVAILQRLISQEQVARKTSKRPLAIPQTLLRMMIAFLLYLVVAIPTLSAPFATPPNLDSAPTYTTSAIQEVNQLVSGGTVLLAFDYSPGLSSELEAASAELINQLRMKNMQLVVVSTLPTGPATAKQFLQKIFPSTETQVGIEYTNMGFIAGGSAALKRISGENIRTTIPLLISIEQEGADPAVTPEETSLWEFPPLNAITTIKDFAMVIVITEDPDTARAWIEQVNPTLDENGTPMILTISAQAEPMIRTYYKNGQVEGIISGVRGGAIYENQPGNTAGVAMNQWTGISLGASLSITMIAIGSGINIVRSLISRRRKNSRGGRK